MFRKKSKTFIWECEYDVWSWMNNKLFAYHIYILILLFLKNTKNQIYFVIWSFKQKAGINKTITNKWTCSFMK